MTGDVHDAAARGYAAAADEYEATRPDYPESAIDRMVQELEIAPGTTVMDLGAGTGKLTRMLLPTGASLVAVEPVEAMRSSFRSVVPDVPVVAGVAEALPFAAGSFDAVVVAQAFHWFRGEPALAEMARVLRPAGRAALIWNLHDESRPWVRRMSEMLEPYERGTPRERHQEWRRALSATTLFGTVHQRRFAHQQRLDQDGFVRRVASTSFVARLPDEEREALLIRVRDLGRQVAGDDGQVVFPYHTELYWCTRA